MALAERVQAEAMAATGAEDLDRMSQAFHRVSRSVRMSVALEAKFARAERDEARVHEAEKAVERPPRPKIVSVPYEGAWPDWDDPSPNPVARTWREREADDWDEKTEIAKAKAFAARLDTEKQLLAADEVPPHLIEALAAARVAQALAQDLAQGPVRREAVRAAKAAEGLNAASPNTS
ncbi:hypothetical protein [Phenylobacterium immobile]|uniref:hypothetical protein n=1 Tax=Phenylobacterium immobile TaxID=21 RepID=UPI00159EBDF4|nr:hypothetical protein [Phenylobacterium immobile]